MRDGAEGRSRGPSPRRAIAVALAVLAGAVPTPAQDRKPPAPVPPATPAKGPVLLRPVEGSRFKLTITESSRVVTPLRVERVEETLLVREGECTVLGPGKDGGTEVRVRFFRASGSRQDTGADPAMGRSQDPIPFDSADPARNAATAPEEVKGYMNDAGRGLDLTLSPRGEVTAMRVPADGSPPHCLFSEKGSDPGMEAYLRSDFQKLFAILPEKEIDRGGAWLVKHPVWDTSATWTLGPFSEKFTLGKRSEGQLTVAVANGEPKRPVPPNGSEKGEVKRKKDPHNAPPKDFDYGPFDLEMKGEMRIAEDSGVLLHRTLSLGLVQLQWQPYTKPERLRITYSCEVESTPAPGK